MIAGGGQEGCPPGWYWIARKGERSEIPDILRKTRIARVFQFVKWRNCSGPTIIWRSHCFSCFQWLA
jgi:hypothetical protein